MRRPPSLTRRCGMACRDSIPRPVFGNEYDRAVRRRLNLFRNSAVPEPRVPRATLSLQNDRIGRIGATNLGHLRDEISGPAEKPDV